VNTVKKKERQERAAQRLVAALSTTGKVRTKKSEKHNWKSEDGPEKAQLCLQRLRSKGINVDEG